MDEQRVAEGNPQTIMTFMTTEHFNLQSARAAANSEISARLQLYLTTLSSTIIALALAAQLPGLGADFRVFAIVLLPIVFLLGLVTLGRLNQLELEWRIYGQGMNRIRHYFTEVAPAMERYFVLPTTDDPWASLEAMGISSKSHTGWLLTGRALIAVVNSVVAGSFAGLLASMAKPGAIALPASCAAVAFAVSAVIIGAVEIRRHNRDMSVGRVEFPADPPVGHGTLGGLV